MQCTSDKIVAKRKKKRVLFGTDVEVKGYNNEDDEKHYKNKIKLRKR